MLSQLDSWEAKYIQSLKDSDLLAWDDYSAWHRYPKYSWVYDKQALAKFTGVPTYDLETEIPDNIHYPCVIKPRTNFTGLSKNMYIADSEDEIEDWQGMIAQQYLEGHQGTADVVFIDGVFKDSFAFTTHKNFYGEIKLFESNPFIPLQVVNKLRELFHGYTGVVNVEYINSDIIEIHLRPSLQFYDICGGFIEQLPTMMKTKKWQKIKHIKTYSRIYRTKHNGTPKVKTLPEKPEAVTSIQFCWEDGKDLRETDPSLGRNRYMVINGTDLQEIEKFGKKIQICIQNS